MLVCIGHSLPLLDPTLFGQGGVLFNKTSSAARDVFDVRTAALERRAQRRRLIRTCKARSELDKRRVLLTIYSCGGFGISLGCALGTNMSLASTPLPKRRDSRAERSYVVRF